MNIFLHGSIYGFKSNLATPATAYGNLVFDYSLLPAMTANTRIREVVFGIREPKTKINVDGVYFSSDSVYTFSYDKQNYRTTISKSNGSVETIPSNTFNIEVPFSEFKQENPETTTFTLPNYNYGSYFTYTFTLTDEYISGINVYIKMPDTPDFIEYSIEKVKYLIDPSATVVFFNQTSADTYTIEFGSGIHAAWVPGAEVKVVLNKTIGVSANFSQNIKANIEVPTQLVMYDKMYDGTVVSTTLDPSQYINVNFDYSEGGIDPLSGEDLRKALVSYIQTRDNFVSEDDFYNVIEKYTTDFRLLFKKMSVQENVFYLQRALRDEYQTPVRSLNMMPNIFKKGQKISGVHYYTNDKGTLTPGLYFYIIRALDTFNNEITTDEIQATLVTSAPSGSIELFWDEIPGAVKYKVYGRTREYPFCYETDKLSFLDDGTNSDTYSTDTGLPEIEEYPYILFPTFEIDNIKFTSPFIYKFNPVFNYFEGWVFYPELIVNFETITQNSGDLESSITLPSIYSNIIYEEKNKRSALSIKSYSSISEWNFSITVPELGIYQEPMEMIDNNTATFYYDKNFGYITDQFQITITGNTHGVNVFSAKTNKINQRYETSDLLQIPSYTHNDISYLVDVPVIQSDVFLPNKTFYLDKILSFILDFNFQENRINFFVLLKK